MLTWNGPVSDGAYTVVPSAISSYKDSFACTGKVLQCSITSQIEAKSANDLQLLSYKHNSLIPVNDSSKVYKLNNNPYAGTR